MDTYGVARLSPWALVLGVLCFLLPFATFSCHNEDIARFSGMQLAFGATGRGVILDQAKGGRNSADEDKPIQSLPFATAAFVAGLWAAFAAFSKVRLIRIISLGLAIGAVICLVVLQGQVTAEWLIHQFNPREGPGNPGIEVRSGVGFFGALLAFAAGAVMNGLFLRTKSAASQDDANRASPQ